MSKHRQPIVKHVGLIGTFCSSLLLSTTPFVAAAEPSPFTSTMRAKQSTAQSSPLPESQPPSAVVRPANGNLSVRLVNRTGAVMKYQAIGDTQERTLAGNSSVTLPGLRVPTTLTFYRQDRGLLRVRPQSSAGLLTVVFTPTTDFSVDKTAMNIQQAGLVYLN